MAQNVQIEVEDFGVSLAEEIKKVSKALQDTPLTNTALIALIKDRNPRINKGDIADVLTTIQRLDGWTVKA